MIYRSVIAIMISAISTIALAGAPSLEKVLNIDSGRQKDWSAMADDGGWNPGDRWQGITPKNLGISHNKTTGEIISFDVYFDMAGNSAASSPKKIRQILEKYCGIKSDAWEGSDVTQQRAIGARCSADYTFKSVQAEIHIDRK
jgi:hypothetical protein